jgi:hypothetical protein
MLQFLVPDSPVLAISGLSQKGVKHEDLKIQGCFKYGRGRKASRNQDIRKFRPEEEVIKTGCSSLGFQIVPFSQNR